MSVLLEAEALVHGDREKQYGSAFHDYSRVAKIWSAILGIEVTAELAALCMVGVKISRLVNSPGHHDSVVDVAGYAEVYHMIRTEREAKA